MSDDFRRTVSAIPDYVDQETIDVLQNLLQSARAGNVTGLVYSAFGKSKLLETGVIGVCAKDPVAALGSVRLLEDHVANHAHESLGTPTPPSDAG